MIFVSLLFSFTCLAMEHHVAQESTTIPTLWQELQAYRGKTPDDTARMLYGRLFALVACDLSFLKDDHQKYIKNPIQTVSRSFFKTKEARDIYILEGISWARQQVRGKKNDDNLAWVGTFIPSATSQTLNCALPTHLCDERLNNLEKIEHYYRSAGLHR